MRIIALSLATVFSVGPVMLAGSAIAADKAATDRQVAALVAPAMAPDQLFYGGVLAPITVEAKTVRPVQIRATAPACADKAV
jgi:hypothetical protein